MGRLFRWWFSLSGESKAAIIAAIVSPVVAEILGWRTRVIRWFYIRDLEKLKVARKRYNEEWQAKQPTGVFVLKSDFSSFLPLDSLAEMANIPVWRAKRAVRWQERVKEYGWN